MKASDASRGLDLLAHKVRELETEVGKLKRRIAAADKARRKVAAAARAAAIEEARGIVLMHELHRGICDQSTHGCVRAVLYALDELRRALAAKPGSDRP